MTAELEAEVRRLESERAAAMLRSDITVLESILDDELVYAHSTGGADTRSSLLAKLSSGAFAYSAYDLEPDRVVAEETVAIVTGRLRAMLKADGRTIQVDSTVTDVWLRRPGGVRLLAVSSRAPSDDAAAQADRGARLGASTSAS